MVFNWCAVWEYAVFNLWLGALVEGASVDISDVGWPVCLVATCHIPFSDMADLEDVAASHRVRKMPLRSPAEDFQI